jgi:hypothetical protein
MAHIMAICILQLLIPSLFPFAAAFQLPEIKFVGISSNDLDAPRRRIENGEADALRQSIEEHCNIFDTSSPASFRWEPNLQESYEIANVIFDEIVQFSRERYHCCPVEVSNAPSDIVSRVISCPSMKRPNDLEEIAKVLRSDKCKSLLGLDDASAELYPSSPSPYLRLSFSNFNSEQNDLETGRLRTNDSAIAATEDWVNNFLGKFNLCPYTSSVTKAAVGLTSVGVPDGKVHIVATNTDSFDTLPAAELVSAFWSETVTLLQSPESDYATSLVVCQEYDNHFEAFVDVCDNILQPIVAATQSTDFIGRAWFHPNYNADEIGHTSVIPGHAVPHKMVEQFIQKLNGLGSTKGSKMRYSDLANANNKVRMTPHATINILRRSQLTAAERYEKGLGDKKPKPNSIYVRNTLKLNDILKADVQADRE